MVSDVGAFLIAMTVALGPIFIVHGLASMLIEEATVSKQDDPEKMVRLNVLNGPSEELFGKAQPYYFSIPEGLIHKTPEEDLIEYYRMSPDGRFSIQVVSSAEHSDMTNLAEQRLQMNSGEGYAASTIESIRNVKLGQSYWTRVQIHAELTDGLKVTEICQATPDGAVIVVVHFTEVPGEESGAGYFQLAEEALDSFRIRE